MFSIEHACCTLVLFEYIFDFTHTMLFTYGMTHAASFFRYCLRVDDHFVQETLIHCKGYANPCSLGIHIVCEIKC